MLFVEPYLEEFYELIVVGGVVQLRSPPQSEEPWQQVLTGSGLLRML